MGSQDTANPGTTSRVVRWKSCRAFASRASHTLGWLRCAFWNDDGTESVGNFQRGDIGFNQVLEWKDVNRVLVFAHGACYSIPARKTPKTTEPPVRMQGTFCLMNYEAF